MAHKSDKSTFSQAFTIHLGSIQGQPKIPKMPNCGRKSCLAKKQKSSNIDSSRTTKRVLWIDEFTKPKASLLPKDIHPLDPRGLGDPLAMTMGFCSQKWVSHGDLERSRWTSPCKGGNCKWVPHKDE